MDKTLWPETTATIYTCGWQDTPLTRRGSGNYIIAYSYQIDGQQYSGEYEDVAPAIEGSQFSLRYNPDDPEQNEKTLEKKRDLWLTIAGAAVLIVGSILYWWGRGRRW